MSEPVAITMSSAVVPLEVRFDRAVGGDLCRVANQRGAHTLEVMRVLGVIEVLDDVGSTPDRVGPRASDRGVVQHRLRRHARNERALTAHAPRLEHDDASAVRCELGRQGFACAARTDHCHVEVTVTCT